jgi:hypothetical protein
VPTDREPSQYKLAACTARWSAAHRPRLRGVWLGRILALSLLVAALTVPAAADAVPPLSSSNGSRFSSTPIPASALRQIAAKHGQFAYVPASIPSGFTFTSWRSERPSQANLLKRLHLTFAHGRTLMVWTVSDGRDVDDYADCLSRPFYDSKRLIGGRSVYYVHGNHGDSAWMCFNAPLAGGGRKPLGIDLWVANQSGRPSPLSAMRIVAGARLARSPAAPAPVAAPLPPTTTTSAPTTTTAPPPPPPPPPPAAGNCAPSYPDVCIPPPPPDLDCKDVSYRGFRVIYNVPSPDPHRFDGDQDGVGCET